MTRTLHTSREAGVTTTQVAVLMPALLLVLMLTVQYGLWYHARQVASAAAAEAVAAAKVPDGTSEAGRQAASRFLDQSGNLHSVDIDVHRDTETVVVEITGEAPQLMVGRSWSVTARSQADVERFVPEPQR